MSETAEPPPRTERRRIPFYVPLVFAVALIFTTIGAVESLFIVYDYFTGAFAFQRAPDLGIGIRSWTEHHALRPGYSDQNFHTNSFGLRTPEVAVPKPAGTFRVLLLGDSFTFGYGVKEDEGFARVLERRLRRDSNRSIEIVNAGVISYCPLLEYLQYVHHLNVLEPDIVILNFDMSDVQDHLIYAESLVRAADGTPLFVTEPSLQKFPSLIPDLLSFQWVARAINAARGRISTVSGGPSARDVDRYAWALDGGPELDREAQAAMDPIAGLSRLLHHQNIPFVLATYPQPWQVSAEATPWPPLREQYGIRLHTIHLNDRSFRKLDRFARDHDLPFLNATDSFRGEANPEGLFLNHDFHFSPRGNVLYAGELARYLEEHGLLPR